MFIKSRNTHPPDTATTTLISICFLFFMAFLAENEAANVNVKDKGAKGDGVTDDSEAITGAWKEVCGATEPGQLLIPEGKYMVCKPLNLDGPCKAPSIEINGVGATLLAPVDPNALNSDTWVGFKNIEKLTLCGVIFDGQGHESWKTNNAAKTGKCSLPYNLRFNFVKNSIIRGITSLNSKNFHMMFLGCDNTNVEGVTIEAPADSINTDGIHIGRTCGLNITDTNIKTGDDCISIGDGTKNLHVQKVTCGPGHGISVGSLGRYPNEEPVDGIWVRDAKITDTDNGVRIKTWPGSFPGCASNMHFEEICMTNVLNPILIDQEYCPYMDCHADTNCSKVKISDVSFKGIRGTSGTKAAIKLVCSQGVPCEKVEISEVDLKYQGKEGGEAVSECKNVQPTVLGAVSPQPCTAPPSPPAGGGGGAAKAGAR